MKNYFPTGIIGKTLLKTNQNYRIKKLKTKIQLIKELLTNNKHILKRTAFLILLIIVAYYIRRDLPAVLAHQELARGLAIFFLVALSGLLLALSLQVHKEKEVIKKKLGENTYNWLAEEE